MGGSGIDDKMLFFLGISITNLGLCVKSGETLIKGVGIELGAHCRKARAEWSEHLFKYFSFRYVTIFANRST